MTKPKMKNFRSYIHIVNHLYKVYDVCLMSVSHSWSELVEAVQEQVKTRSSELKRELKRCGVFYLNARGQIVAPHTVEVKQL